MKQIKLYDTAAACSGCGACLTACPVQAISMEFDDLGCTFPKINEEKCVQCGKCLRICPYHQPLPGQPPVAAYAAVGRSEEIVQNSASGGVFASLAKKFMCDGGCAAGAVMRWENNTADVFHLLSSDDKDLVLMQGSKYVQSRAWESFPEILEQIQSGYKVLFCGTPCQVAAIRKLTADSEYLITMDLVCHGVPPVRLLNEAGAILVKRMGGNLKNLVFRDKSCGKSFCARVDTENRGKSRRCFLSSRLFSFYQLFLEGSIYRESCYSCPYASMKRISDITVGDYWGVQQFHGKAMEEGSMPDRKDWSCVLVNTAKGAQFLEEYGQALYLFGSRVEWVAANNGQLNKPSSKPENRKEILAQYGRGGYPAVESWFIHRNGGYLRFYHRLYKSIYQNRTILRNNKGKIHED